MCILQVNSYAKSIHKNFMRYIFYLIISLPFLACNKHEPLFREISAEKSGIQFVNQITESPQLNVLNYEYINNGGGIGIGDFNNDGLPDIYFTGNQVSNKLYINKGNLHFVDITKEAGVDGNAKWSKGASIIDINNDGLLDIYVCAATLPDSNSKRNILYVNQGIDKATGYPIFKDMAAEYGLNIVANTQMAAFFDYDNDGDLDVYLLLNDLDGTYPNEFRPIRKDGSWPNTGKLLENNFSKTLKHPVFTDVSAKAGILIEGHGLGVSIADINNDGWKDIYVSNDYLSNNILYINNKDGTFTDHCADYLKHTSRNAMGNDIADINNDGKADIIETDMMPSDNFRQKMMHGEMNYQNFQNSERFGYMYQYPRNTLQLNQGFSIKENDSIGIPVFSEIAYFSGVAQTDWSWAPLLVDVDNDGFRDLLISNGLPKDMSDMDFMAYRKNAVANAPLEDVLKQLPVVKISNNIFHNNGNLTFADKTKEWGWDIPTFSAGMAYADFDGDGDIDVVVNNTNMPITFLENTLNEQKDHEHFIRIKLNGDSNNINGIGAFIHVYAKDTHQTYENSPYRGYLSTIENIAHFGLGKNSLVDSIRVEWPGNKQQTIVHPKSDQTLTLNIKNAITNNPPSQLPKATGNWFTDITKLAGINYVYAEVDFIDFDIQRLIPHKLTQYGPSIAVGDINGDGLADFITGGGSPFCATIFTQTKTGQFSKKKLINSSIPQLQDDAGLCLFDADGDNDLDLFIVSGGAENEPQSKAYMDHFFVNDGKGNFTESVIDITNNRATKSCIIAADYDNDGDLDLFIGGRVIPGRYPSPTSSFLYRNDSKNGKIIFTDVTSKIAPDLQNIGMVTSAVWSDINNDHKIDLLITTEWGAIITLQNQGNKLVKVNNNISNETGWWNSITAADIDNDGDMDYIVGNFGQNGYLKPSTQFPIKAYAKDFDNNTSFDAVFSSFLPSTINGPIKEFPIAGRDEFLREMTAMKERFPNYTSYAKSTMQEVFSPEIMKGALALSVVNFNTCWIENKGQFNFVLHPLPVQAQLAPVYGIVAKDFDGDGNIDIALNGNEYSMAPYLGRYDAFNGLILKGNGKGEFEPLSILQSGFYISGNGKGLAEIVVNNRLSLIGGQNNGPLKLFKNNNQLKIVPLLATDRYCRIHLKNGKIRKEEILTGSSFLSQSGNYLLLNNSINYAEIIDQKGRIKVVKN